MATDKPRITITLDQQTLDVYRRFAQLSRQPTATIIANMLTEARDHFVQLGVLLQQAEQLEMQSAEQQSAFLARIQMGAHRAQAASELVQSDLLTFAPPPPTSTALAGVAVKGAKKGPQSLIHTNKVPKPRPATVSAVSSKKAKGGKRAST